MMVKTIYYVNTRISLKSKVGSIVCIGEENKRISEDVRNDAKLIINAISAKDSIESAYNLAKRERSILWEIEYLIN